MYAEEDGASEYALHRFHKIRNAAMIGIERYTPMNITQLLRSLRLSAGPRSIKSSRE